MSGWNVGDSQGLCRDPGLAAVTALVAGTTPGPKEQGRELATETWKGRIV